MDLWKKMDDSLNKRDAMDLLTTGENLTLCRLTLGTLLQGYWLLAIQNVVAHQI